MGKHYGRCALCGKECELTFEHIPPRSAFNSTAMKPVTGDQLIVDTDRMPWDMTELHYLNQQQGMGKYSLCSSCNNNTGTWYGNDYVFIARVVHQIISHPIEVGVNGVGIKDVHPLRFIKQILSFFCSINHFEDDRIDILRKFVLDKDLVGLDKAQYKLCMYFTKGYFMKYAPLSVILAKSENSYEAMAVSEITAYPLGFILYFNPTDTWAYEGIDITCFADCKYDTIANIEMGLCIKEMNDIFPGYYRSKDEIRECIDSNRKFMEIPKEE